MPVSLSVKQAGRMGRGLWLALELGGPLVTFDRRLAAVAGQLGLS